MPLTTTTTYTTRILAEVIAELVLAAPTPKNVLSKLANIQSIQGEPALSLAMPRYADLGAASLVAENADIASTALAMGTESTFTPAEYGMMGEVTYRAARRKVPGLSSVHQLFDGSATLDQQLAVFSGEAMRLKGAIDEAVETQCSIALTSLTDVVGTTTVDLSIADMEAAIYAQAINEILNEDLAFTLAPIQMYDLRAAITSSTAPVFSTDIQSVTTVRPDMSLDGLRGAFMGIPVYEISNSVVQTANAGADVVGALVIRGRGEATAATSGTLVICEGENLYFSFEADNSARAVEVQAVYEFDAGLRATDMGVQIVTDA